MSDGVKIALQICTKKNYVDYMNSMTNDFSAAGIKLCFIMLDDDEKIFSENQTYYGERRMFYETLNKEMIAINSNCINVLQCKKDSKIYEHDGEILNFSNSYSEIFNLNSSISNLDFVNNELTIIGFDKSYTMWLEEKRLIFEEAIKQKEKTKKIFI